MFPLSKWHAIWLALAVIVCAVAATAARKRHAAPAGPVPMTTVAPAGPVSVTEHVAGSRTVSATPRASSIAEAPIYVHVSGQVARPGLYRMRPGSRVMDAVTGAGGATGEANLDALNLATPLYDGQKLIVPGFGEPPPQDTGGYLQDPPPPPEAVLVRPDPVPAPIPAPLPAWNPAPPLPAPVTTGAAVFGTAPAPSGYGAATGGSRTGSLGKLRHPGEGVVHINRASSAELQRLPGVGPATAARILEYRNAHGGFRSIEELMEVKGIGEKKLAKMAPFVSLR